MPINKKDYPSDWNWLSKQIIKREDNKCYFCHAENGLPHWLTGSIVVLTVAHLDHDTTNRHPLNLVACCQRCHLRIDLYEHHINRKKTINERRQGNEKNQINTNAGQGG